MSWRILSHLSLIVILLAGLLSCSKEGKEAIGVPIDPNAPVVQMAELLKNPKTYEGKIIVMEGQMSDICADGEDFFFKDRFDLIEVIPPKEGMPAKSNLGSPLRVYGRVLIKEESSEEEGAEGHEKTAEVKLEAKGLEFLHR